MLQTLFGSKLRAKLLGWLMTHADERYFVRQLTGILGEDPTNVSRELTKLARAGILLSRQEGRQKYYQADPQSPVFEELRSLSIKTIGVGDFLREAIRPLAGRIRAAYIFGSFAESRANARSDVDVLIVGEVSSADVIAAFGPAQQRLNREINPVIYPVAEFTKKRTEKNYFLNSIQDGKKIFIIGDEDELKRLAKERLAG
jgi:predicted nucleotidyltransferase